MIGMKILGKGGLFSTSLDGLFRVGSIGMRMIGENLYGNYRVVSSRVTGRPLVLTPIPNVRPILIAFICIPGAISMSISWKLGWSSMTQLFSVFATVLYILVAACVVLGLRKIRKDSEEKKGIVRVPKCRLNKFKFFLS